MEPRQILTSSQVVREIGQFIIQNIDFLPPTHFRAIQRFAIQIARYLSLQFLDLLTSFTCLQCLLHFLSNVPHLQRNDPTPNGTIMKARLFAHRHVFSSTTYQVPRRSFASTVPRAVKNRVYTSVRSHDEFDSLLLLSASARTPLLTFWTASWCPSCRVVKPIVKEAVENGVGEEQGGVGFVEVEFDAPGMGDLGMRYFVGGIYTSNGGRPERADVRLMTAADQFYAIVVEFQ
ncbi:hypothetical protein G7Y79_00019g046710 [Physcia stellaris]|nr:hypothetical protein G7Y79_00019g046710 [Physcia stellaris]